MGTHQPIRKAVTPEIPDKLYFRIGDVARLCEVPTYVLRFWETEFPQLKPNKGGTGQRLYRRKDVELALRIKSLLYDQGYTIPGARQVFKNESAARSATAAAAIVEAAVPAEQNVATWEIPKLSPDEDPGAALRQRARMRDLRDELAALLSCLQRSSPNQTRPDDERRLEPKLPVVQPMRPRLVLEPRPAALLRRQHDLFTRDGHSDDDWPEPPVAS